MLSRDPERRKASNREANARYRATHPDAVKARKALWYQLNKEKRRQSQKAYRDTLHAEQAETLLRSLDSHLSA